MSADIQNTCAAGLGFPNQPAYRALPCRACRSLRPRPWHMFPGCLCFRSLSSLAPPSWAVITPSCSPSFRPLLPIATWLLPGHPHVAARGHAPQPRTPSTSAAPRVRTKPPRMACWAQPHLFPPSQPLTLGPLYTLFFWHRYWYLSHLLKSPSTFAHSPRPQGLLPPPPFSPDSPLVCDGLALPPSSSVHPVGLGLLSPGPAVLGQLQEVLSEGQRA